MSAEHYAPIIITGVFGCVSLAVMVCVWPWLGYGLLVSIPVVKVLLRNVAGGLLSGYTYDVAAALLALLGALIHRSRRRNLCGAPIPGYLVACWCALIVMLWGRSIGAPNVDWAIKKSLIFSIFNTLALASLPAYLLSPREARWLLRTFLIVGIVASLALPIFGKGTEDYQGARVSLGQTSPLLMSGLIVNAMIIMLCMLISKRTTANIALSAVFIPVCALAVFLTGTRGPFFVLPILLPVVFWFYRRKLNFQAAMACLVGLGLVVVVTVFIVDPSKLARFSGGAMVDAVKSRIAFSMITIRGFLSSPIIGTGTGSTAYLITGRADGIIYPHNHMLEVACELGIFGLIAWALIMIAGFRAGWSLTRPEWEDTEAKYVGVPIFMGFLYEFITSFKMGTFCASYMLYFYLFATIILGSLRQRDLMLWRKQVAEYNYWRWLGMHSQQEDTVPTGHAAKVHRTS